jgi:hypothetical protein
MSNGDDRSGNNSKSLDFSDPDTIAFLTEQKHRFEAQRDRSSGEANSTERSLSGQLILLTTVLITVNVIALGNGSLLDQLSIDQKILILAVFVLETLSTAYGIRHYFAMENSYNKWADAYHEVTTIIDSKDYSTTQELSEKIKNTQNGLDIHPSRPALNKQVYCILASFVVYLLLLIAILFNFRNHLTL